MSKFLYPIYKLNIESYKKWWLYHKKAGGSGILSEILEGFSFNLENTLNRKFNLFEIEGNSVQDGTPTPENPIEIHSTGDSGSVNEKVQNKNLCESFYIASTVQEYIRVLFAQFDIKPNTTYTISFKTNQDGYAFYFNEGLFTTSRPFQTSSNGRSYFTATTKSKQELENLSSYDKTNNGFAILKNYRNQSTTPTFSDVQIEQGTTATDYTAHEEQNITIPCQQPMRAIGEYKDTFVKVDGTWYERHYIGQKIFDGSESRWGFGPSGVQNMNVTNISISSMLVSNFGLGLCNYFIRGTSKIANTLRFGANDSQLWFYIKSTDFANINDWKTWLSNNNVEVIYVLATPIDLPCTEEQVEQLENKPSTYKDFTIIQSQDETPAYLKIQYYKEG